jgi:site-specific DNA-methyltransferase (adenine-specific)
MRKEVIGECELWCGDCRDVLPLLDPVDALVTDPPWGLGELSGTVSKERNRNAYTSYQDTEANIIAVVIPAIVQSLQLANGRGLIASGVKQMWNYPRPRTVGGFYQPAAVGRSGWGFVGYSPVLFYGKDPRDGKGQDIVMTVITEKASNDEHPCAKPLKAMKWMVNKASLEGESVMDPFMGSGTTGVACAKLGRRFFGIEIEPRYFEIAVKRIEQAYREPDLFSRLPQLKQENLFA